MSDKFFAGEPFWPHTDVCGTAFCPPPTEVLRKGLCALTPEKGALRLARRALFECGRFSLRTENEYQPTPADSRPDYCGTCRERVMRFTVVKALPATLISAPVPFGWV